MKFFIDSADPGEIRDLRRAGSDRGRHHRPDADRQGSDRRSAREPQALLAEICEVVQGPVSAEVVSEDKDGMMREARTLAKIAPNIVVKLPLTHRRAEGGPRLRRRGIKTNVTPCF